MKTQTIANVAIATPAGLVARGSVSFVDGRITKLATGAEVASTDFDGQGMTLLPAYWDLHSHGGYGFWFNEMAAFDEAKALRYLAGVVNEGVGAVTACVVTDTEENLQAIAANYRKLKALDEHGVVRGIYLEGPFISPGRKGAHDPSLMAAPTWDRLAPLLTKDVVVVTVAPDGGSSATYEAIARASKKASVSVGHSDATMAEALEAFKNGANRVTHLYNAMSPFAHRDPGAVNAVFAAEGLFVELIPDGTHVAPAVVNETLKLLKDRHKFMFVSDSMGLKGTELKEAKLGPVAVSRDGDFFYVKGTKTLAGSALPFDRLVANYAGYSGDEGEAIARYAATNAADSLGRKDDGRIQEGAVASFVLVDALYGVKAVWLRGKRVK